MIFQVSTTVRYKTVEGESLGEFGKLDDLPKFSFLNVEVFSV